MTVTQKSALAVAATTDEGDVQNTTNDGGEQNMSIIAEAQATDQEWRDISTIPGAGLIAPGNVAVALERRAGQLLTRRGYQTLLLHPALAEAVETWYEDLPSTLDALVATLAELQTSPPAIEEPMTPEDVDDEDAPCSLFAWCEGHNRIFSESDGCHMTHIEAGRFAGGESKLVHVMRYLPTEEDGEPARWSFSMPEGGEWSFGPDTVDAEIAEGIADLERARQAIAKFLAAHDDDHQLAGSIEATWAAEGAQEIAQLARDVNTGRATEIVLIDPSMPTDHPVQFIGTDVARALALRLYELADELGRQ